MKSNKSMLIFFFYIFFYGFPHFVHFMYETLAYGDVWVRVTWSKFVKRWWKKKNKKESNICVMIKEVKWPSTCVDNKRVHTLVTDTNLILRGVFLIFFDQHWCYEFVHSKVSPLVINWIFNNYYLKSTWMEQATNRKAVKNIFRQYSL